MMSMTSFWGVFNAKFEHISRLFLVLLLLTLDRKMFAGNCMKLSRIENHLVLGKSTTTLFSASKSCAKLCMKTFSMKKKFVNWKVKKYLFKNFINFQLLEESPNTAILTINKSCGNCQHFSYMQTLKFWKVQ